MFSVYCLAVFDDEAIWAEDLRSRILRHPLSSEFDINLCSTEAELRELASKQHVDVLFADICLNGQGGASDKDGVDIVLDLNLQAQGTQIVYVTGVEGTYSRVRKAQVTHFLMKPVRDDELYSVLDKAILAVRSWAPRLLVLHCLQGECRIDPREIVYVESDKRKVRIHRVSGRALCTYMKLSDIQELLPSPFFQVHRSYIVNMDYADTLHKESLELKTGDIVPVARGRQCAVQEALMHL